MAEGFECTKKGKSFYILTPFDEIFRAEKLFSYRLLPFFIDRCLSGTRKILKVKGFRIGENEDGLSLSRCSENRYFSTIEFNYSEYRPEGIFERSDLARLDLLLYLIKKYERYFYG